MESTLLVLSCVVGIKMKSKHILENLKKRTLGGFRVRAVKVGNDDIDEAQDPKFLAFMNKTLGQKVDTDSEVSNPSNVITTGLSNMPGVRSAIKFGLSVMSLVSKNPVTRAKMMSVDNDQIVEVIATVASRSGRLDNNFDYDDIVKAQDFLQDILYNSNIQTWQDVLKYPVKISRTINEITVDAFGRKQIFPQVYAMLPGIFEYKMLIADVDSEKEFIDTWNQLPSEFKEIFSGRVPLWRDNGSDRFYNAKTVKITFKKYISLIAKSILTRYRLTQKEKDKLEKIASQEGNLNESKLAAYRYAFLLAKKLKQDLDRYKEVSMDDEDNGMTTAGDLLKKLKKRETMSDQAIEQLKKEIAFGYKELEALGYHYNPESSTLLSEDDLLDSPQFVAKNLLKNMRQYKQLVANQTPITMKDLLRLRQNIIDGHDDLKSMGYKFDPVSSNLVAKMYEAIKLSAPHQKIDRKELHSYLDRIKKGEKTKKDKFAPIVHKSNIKAITKSDDINDAWDLDDLATQITTRPKNILGTNAKMEKSATEGEMVYDLTLPALKGLVIDEETGDFVEISTCPGAGECQLFCYARKGGYVMFPASSMSAAQALNFLVNDPVGYSARVNREIQAAKKKTDKHGIKLVVRWHDAGDFFSKQYLDLAFDVARANPEVSFYAYTKIGDVATADKPENFIINFSSGSKRGEEKKIEIHKSKGNIVKQGVTVPKDMFFDLIAREGNKLIKDEQGRTQFKDQDALDEFKQRLARAYNVDPTTIISYDQMLSIPAGDKPVWNVIVQPGAGDRAANRRDVIDSYLMFH